MNYTELHPKKLWPSLSGRLYGLRLLRSWFIRWNPLFLRLGCEVMDPCFVHSNESTQNYVKTSPNIVLNCSYKIEITVPLWYAYGLNKLAHFHSSISQNNIMDFIDDFWKQPIGCLERGASHVDVRSCLNSFTQLYTVANGADVLWKMYYPTRLSFRFFSSVDFLNLSYRCLIIALNLFFSILQKIQRLFALIVYRNKTTRWIPRQNLTVISWEMLLVKK